MAKKNQTLRVFFSKHHDGHLTGKLLRRPRFLFETPPPAAYGATEEAVLSALTVLLGARLDAHEEKIDAYLFEDEFQTRTVTVEVHPYTWHQKRPIISKARIPVQLTYGATQLKGGPWLLTVPHFNWWLTIEELSMADSVLRDQLAAYLTGDHAKSMYDYRIEGEEFIREWNPRFLEQAKQKKEKPPTDTDRFPTLATVGDELVQLAEKGKLPAISTDLAAIRPMLRFVQASPPTPLLVVGGPGVGKSTWVLQLAQSLAAVRREGSKTPVPRIWRTSADRIIAGMVYLGMWQERCLRLVNELSHEGDYLYVDRLPDILHPQSDGASIAEIFMPAVLSGEISLIAECTESELERCQRRAPALVNAFHVVRLSEPPAATMPVLLQRHLEARRSPLQFHPSALLELTRLLSVFQRDTLFPGKAFRFLDWLGKEAEERTRTIYPRDVTQAFSRLSGLPVELISDEYPVSRDRIATSLQRAVIGQNEACVACAGVLTRFKAGLNDPEKPLGALLFAGPTGVGKTELAKQLARYLFGNEDRLIRLDSSEYAVPGSAQRLLAAGQGAQSLAERGRKQPLSVVLVDEVEKAHPEVFDLLLGVLGEGRLTDETGRFVDFRMTLIVMTSNLGISSTEAVGFGDVRGDDPLRAIRDHFRPEFVNRLDRIIPFRRLSLEDVERIVDLELDKARRRLGFVRREVALKLSSAAKKQLAALGYDPRMGARPLKRVLEEAVVAPLAQRLAAEPELRERSLEIVLAGEPASVGAERFELP